MRKRLTSVALVGLLLGLALGPVAAAPRAGPTDWSGTYDGHLGAALALDKVYTDTIHFEVSGLELKGGLEFRGEGASKGKLLGGDFNLSLCILLKVSLTGSELKGIPVQGDEVAWTGPVDIASGAGDPQKVDCRTIGPSKSLPAKLDVTVGSSGLRGSLIAAGSSVPFTATRTSATTPGGGGTSGPSTSAPDSSGAGAGTTPTGKLLVKLIGDQLGPTAADNVLSRLDRTTEFAGFDVAGLHQLDGLTASDATNQTAEIFEAAVLLGAATATGADGRTTVAFPNVRALVPVFDKLAMHAAGPPADASARRAMARLLELALALDGAP
ncbi:MAG: hypothetical protein JWN46_1527 [Acidimicrobiales bacterium]|nr:hypothetical protein [Acidimicrobiales bacterium]